MLISSNLVPVVPHELRFHYSAQVDSGPTVVRAAMKWNAYGDIKEGYTAQKSDPLECCFLCPVGDVVVPYENHKNVPGRWQSMTLAGVEESDRSGVRRRRDMRRRSSTLRVITARGLPPRTYLLLQAGGIYSVAGVPGALTSVDIHEFAPGDKCAVVRVLKWCTTLRGLNFLSEPRRTQLKLNQPQGPPAQFEPDPVRPSVGRTNVIKPLFSFTEPCTLFEPAPPKPFLEIQKERQRQQAQLDLFLIEEIERFDQLDKSLQTGDEDDPLILYTEEELSCL